MIQHDTQRIVLPDNTSLKPLFGYFPGKRLRAVCDLPRHVVLQWRRWCLHPEYLLGVEGDAVRRAYARFDKPMYSLSFTDDEMMSALSTELLHGFYVNANIDKQRVAPDEFSLARIGHFGFFRPQFEASLWPLTVRWLDAKLSARSTAPAPRTPRFQTARAS